jgi:hypothetical protein
MGRSPRGEGGWEDVSRQIPSPYMLEAVAALVGLCIAGGSPISQAVVL